MRGREGMGGEGRGLGEGVVKRHYLTTDFSKTPSGDPQKK